MNELTDRKSWRGGLRVTLANGMTVEKALAKLKAASAKKTRQEQKDRWATSNEEGRGWGVEAMRLFALLVVSLGAGAGGGG